MLSRSILLLLHGLASMNSRLTFAARPVIASRTAHEDRNRRRPIKALAFGLPCGPRPRPCCHRQSSGPQVGSSLACQIALRPSLTLLTRAAASATRGRRVGRGRGGARKNERVPKTAADLDAEMEVSSATSARGSSTH